MELRRMISPRGVVPATLAVLAFLFLSAFAGSPTSIPATAPTLHAGHLAAGPKLDRTSPEPIVAQFAHRAVSGPLAGPVNPQRGYSTEPAPMGVADFGVDGSGHPYGYSTSQFLGTATIASLKANVVGNPSAGNVAFELNTVLAYSVGASNYVYWLQDGFDVESHSEHVSLLQDYVWNFTAPGATLNSASVAGNGSLVNFGGYNVYITYPPRTLPGSNITLTFPLSLQLRVVSGTAGPMAIPWVGYDYNDGFGWIRGANVSFPFAQFAAGVGQVVNGSRYTPNGAFFDAEFDYAGPGGGTGLDTGTSMSIVLDRWNGHNLQAVPNAYDHGGNTGEKIQNLTVAATGGLGEPGASLTDGTGTLGLLYSMNQTGSVIVTAPWGSGQIGVNGAPLAFEGGQANLTLSPGLYQFTLYQGPEIVGRITAAIAPGDDGTLQLVPNLLEAVTITAVGLPSGTHWSVWWNGTRVNGTAPSIQIIALNGTYPMTTRAIGGFVPKQTTVQVTVRGATRLSLAWTTFNYTVTFTEIGLPNGDSWWVESNGVQNHSAGTKVRLSLPNGTSEFSVGGPSAYLPVPAVGNVTVGAGPVAQSVSFIAKPSYLVGTLAPGNANLEVDGAAASVQAGQFNISVAPGVHAVSASLAGYVTYHTNLTTTAGNRTVLSITLTPLPASPSAPSVGMPTTQEYAILGGIAAAIVIASLVVVLRLRRRAPPA